MFNDEEIVLEVLEVSKILLINGFRIMFSYFLKRLLQVPAITETRKQYIFESDEYRTINKDKIQSLFAILRLVRGLCLY